MAADSSFPSVTAEHTTDREAKAIIDRLLAKDWLVHRILEHDYGRDYLIEAIVDAQPSGKMLHAQLKGTRGVTFDASGRASWALETRHLRYYWERVDQPVFLFVVDVVAEQGWFCFVQGELPSTDAQDKLLGQKSVTLRLRLDNSLGDPTRMLAALDQARAFMRDKNPGSLEAALRSAALAHDQIDPHFAITGAEVKNGHTCFRLAPKHPFSFSIHVPAPQAANVRPRIDELFRYGRPLELTTEEVDFDGLPLFAQAKSDGRRGYLAFKPGDLLGCEVSISAGNRNPFTLTFTGNLSRGTDGGLIVGELKDAPLGIEIRFDRERLLKNQSATIEFTWDLSRWVGKPLVSLPQIEPIAAFWDALLPGTSINVTVSQSGNRLTRGRFGRKRLPQRYHPHQRLCAMLRKAREIAIAQRRQTILPEAETLLTFDWDVIDIAYDLICRRGYERSAPNLRMELDPHPDNKKFRALFKDGPDVSGFARVEYRPYTIKAFGETWELGAAFCEMGPITCFMTKREDGTPRGEIHGKQGTVLRIAKLLPEPEALTLSTP